MAGKAKTAQEIIAEAPGNAAPPAPEATAAAQVATIAPAQKAQTPEEKHKAFLKGKRPTAIHMKLSVEDHNQFTIDIADGVQPGDIMSDPHFLWTLNSRINKGDELHLRDVVWRWEMRVRVMHKDATLNAFSLSPIGDVVWHEANAPQIDWDACTVVHAGDRAKYTVRFGKTTIADGFESESFAYEYITRRKRGVAA